jgi:hypothetical protein
MLLGVACTGKGSCPPALSSPLLPFPSLSAPPCCTLPFRLAAPSSTACREFQTPDEEMKKIVLKVVKQCVGTDGVEPDYIRTEVGGQ